MKKNVFISVVSTSRIILLALACVLTFSLTSCSKDDDSNPYEKKIVGLWVSGTKSYRFAPDGTGDFRNGDILADFKYKMNSYRVNMSLSYVNTKYKSVWKGELSGTLSKEKDELYIKYTVGNETFVKKRELTRDGSR